MKKIFNGAHTTPEGSGWGPFWCPQHFTNDSSRRPSNTIRIGIGTLWCAKGIYFRILKSHAKTFAPAKFWKRFPTTPIQHLRDRDGRPLICDRASFRKSRVAGFFFASAKFWKRFSTAPIQYLRDRDVRSLVCDRNLLRNSKIACKLFRSRKISPNPKP